MIAINCNNEQPGPQLASALLVTEARCLLMESGYADFCVPYPKIQQMLNSLRSVANTVEGLYSKSDVTFAYSVASQHILHRCFLLPMVKANLLFKQSENGSLIPAPALQKALVISFKEKGITTTNEDFCYVVTRVDNTKVSTVHVSTPTNDFKYLLTVFTEGTL